MPSGGKIPALPSFGIKAPFTMNGMRSNMRRRCAETKGQVMKNDWRGTWELLGTCYWTEDLPGDIWPLAPIRY